MVGRADLLCALTVFLSFLSYVRSCQIGKCKVHLSFCMSKALPVYRPAKLLTRIYCAVDAEHIHRPSSVSLPWLALSMSLCAVSVLFKEHGITSLVGLK